MANKYTDRELLDFNYKESDKVNSIGQQKTASEQALSNLGAYNFVYGRQGDYDAAMDAILNRKKFSYDLNGDALYQQYKDNFVNQGKLASADVMGQAAAMTGGYGNSYAATVGNQAYQASLQNLNNIVPELYQLALSAYNAEGDRLNNNLNVLGTDRQLQESSYNNKYSADLTRLTSDRDYYNTLYNNERTFDYSSQKDAVDSNNTAYWNEYSTGYQAERDRIADEQWQKSYNLQNAQVINNEKAAAYDAIVASQKNVSDAKKKIVSEAEFKKAAAKLNGWTTEKVGLFDIPAPNVEFTYNGKKYDSYNDYVFKTLDSMDLSDDEIASILKDLGL